MSDHRVHVRCQLCGYNVPVEMAVGQLVRCPHCQTTFIAPIDETESAPNGKEPNASDPHSTHPPSKTTPAIHSAETITMDQVDLDPGITGGTAAEENGLAPTQPETSPESPAAAESLRREPAPNESAPNESAPSESAQTEPPTEQVPTRPNERAADVAEHTPASADALQTSSLDEGPTTDDSAPVEPEEGHALNWAMPGVFVIITTLAVGAVIVFFQRDQNPQTSPDDPSTVPATANKSWVDASRSTARIARVVVRVRRVAFEPIVAKNRSNEVITSQQQKYLTVSVELTNRSTDISLYNSWYGNLFKNLRGDEVVASIEDDLGESLMMMTFDDVTGVKGHIEHVTMEPRDRAEDLLVFEVPDGFWRRDFRVLRLELPAEALGVHGAFRFEIPRDMIDGLPSVKAEAVELKD